MVDLIVGDPQRGAMTCRDGAVGIALFDDQYIQDPYPLYERMHAEGRVHRIGDSDFYAVTGWDTVNEAVARCDDFSSNLTATMMCDADGTVSAFPMGELGGPRRCSPRPMTRRTPRTARR